MRIDERDVERPRPVVPGRLLAQESLGLSSYGAVIAGVLTLARAGPEHELALVNRRHPVPQEGVDVHVDVHHVHGDTLIWEAGRVVRPPIVQLANGRDAVPCSVSRCPHDAACAPVYGVELSQDSRT